MRSKSPHPRIQVAAPSHLDVMKLGNVKIAGPWLNVYAETKPVPAGKCDGRYVIENPKVDEVLKIHVFKGRCVGVRLKWITVDGPKGGGEEPYDASRMVRVLVLEDGSPLVGVYRFRKRC